MGEWGRGGVKAWLYLEVFGGAAAELVSRLGVVGAAVFARRVAVLGAVHVQRLADHLWGSSPGAGQSAGPSLVFGLGAHAVEQNPGKGAVVLSGREGGRVVGVVMVAVAALDGGAEVARGGSLCGRRAPVVGLVSLKALGGPVLRSQVQAGGLHPQDAATV